jgi:hypothetical protein
LDPLSIYLAGFYTPILLFGLGSLIHDFFSSKGIRARARQWRKEEKALQEDWKKFYNDHLAKCHLHEEEK